MTITLPELPFSNDALEPHITAHTLSFHYAKHHAGYVNKLNAAIADTPNAGKTLEELIMTTEGGVFNNAAQVWNHTFYWNSMTPNGGGEPTGDLAAKINAKWGSFAAFRDAFAKAAATNFGSGWTWLVLDGGNLDIVNTSNAANPMRDGKTPLLTIDVWEHAYYLDFQNARPNYISAFLDHLVNWEFAASNLANA